MSTSGRVVLETSPPLLEARTRALLQSRSSLFFCYRAQHENSEIFNRGVGRRHSKSCRTLNPIVSATSSEGYISPRGNSQLGKSMQVPARRQLGTAELGTAWLAVANRGYVFLWLSSFVSTLENLVHWPGDEAQAEPSCNAGQYLCHATACRAPKHQHKE